MGSAIKQIGIPENWAGLSEKESGKPDVSHFLLTVLLPFTQ